MLFNCFSCGKKISSQKNICVYCKASVAGFIEELGKTAQTAGVKEKYHGTFWAFLKAR